MRTSTFAAAFLLTLAIAPSVRADEQSDLDKGRNVYLARQYDEADARFRTMLDPRTGTLHDPALIAQAQMYWGAVMIAKGRPQDASALFEKLLLRDAHYEPDPLSFPPDVLDAFVDTRTRIRDSLNAAARENARREADRKAREEAEKQRQIERLKLLERLASEEEIIERHYRFVAFVPFGAGQFQNGQKALGWIFLGVESSLVLAGAVTVPLYYAELKAASDEYMPATNMFATSQGQTHLDRANTYRVANLTLYAGFAATALIGIAQANLAYVPDLHITQKRVVKASPFIAPTLAPLTSETGVSGGILGFTGRF